MMATAEIGFAGVAETPLLSNEVRGYVDFKRRPAVRSKTGRWKSASFIIGVELAERVAFYGIGTNLISYLTGPMGQSTAAAAANVNTWSGTARLLPLVGGFVADSFVGRYRMIIASSLLCVLGLGFLSVSAALHRGSYEPDCNAMQNMACPPPPGEVIFFFLSLYLVALAQGGNKPCILAFGADQFDDDDQEESEAKASFFNWWNFFAGGLTMLVVFVLNYIQDNLNWELAFGIPCIIMCVALLVFLLGSMTYRFHIDGGGRSLLVILCQVFVKARRDWIGIPKTGSVQEEAGSILPCEDARLKASEPLLSPDGSEENERPHVSNDAEFNKGVLRLLSIWSTCLGYSTLRSQISTLFVKQAATMDRHITSSFQIPVASIQSSIEVAFIVFIPIYDRILVPVARGITKKPSGISLLQRIGTGIFLSLVAMMVAAFVEMKRLAVAEERDMPSGTVPMSVWWLAPQYIVIGVADGFTIVGLQEFFYSEVPGEFRSIGVSLYLSVTGVGHFLSSFLVAVVSKMTGGEEGWISDNMDHAHLDYFYWLLCGIGTFAFVGYLYFARSYVYR